jgi:hypothetical protein
MKILLNSRVNVKKDNILEPIIQNDCTHETGNYNGIRKINFAISENTTVKNVTLPHMMKIIF